MLTKEQILAKDDLVIEKVEIPEWKDHVYVRTMTSLDRDKYEAHLVSNTVDKTRANLIGIRAKVASWSVCDDKGKLLFTEADIVALNEKSCAAMDRIFDVAQRLNHVTEEQIKEAVKN